MPLKAKKFKLELNDFFRLFHNGFSLLQCQLIDNLVFE